MIKDSTIARTIGRAMTRVSKACLIAVIGISNVFATGQSQSFTFSIENVELKEVLQIVEKNSDYRFLYRSDDISGVKVSSLRVQGGSIDDVMAQCLTAHLSYEKDGTLVMIRRIADANNTQQPQASTTVRGRVTDKQGAAVIGASVLIKGTQTGTITDGNGEFSMSVPDAQNAVLVFTYLGMKPVETPIGGRTNITVVMEENARDIEGIVVTGYQTLSSREAANSTFTVKTEDIHMEGVTTIDKMLQGRIPGMFVMTTSGEPSSTPKIRIRGNSTINGNKSPVWVVDGVILEQDVPFSASDLNSEDAEYLIGNAIAGINPQDIETITVLKDASATAIYGVKAANGVIVLTTKKGHTGKPRISYYGDFNINQRPSYRNLDLMDSKERVRLSKEIVESGLQYSQVPMNDDSYEGLLAQLYLKQITTDQFSSGVMALQKRNTDWFDLLFRNSFTQSHNVNVSGGGETARYYFSAGYNDTPGAALGSDSRRFTSLAKVDVDVNRFVKFTAKIDYSTSENDGYNGVSPFDYAYKHSRTLTPYNEDGSYRMLNESGTGGFVYNIFNELDNTGSKSKTNDFNALLDLKVMLFGGLSYQGTFSFHNSSSNQRTWATEASYAVANIRRYDYGQYTEADDRYQSSKLPYGGTLSQANTNKTGYTVRNMLSFVRSFDKHDVNVIAGVEARSNKYKGVSVLGYGWSPDFGELFMPVYTDSYMDLVKDGVFNPRNTNKLTQVASFLASGSYTYDNRYVINANIRSDGANKFGSNPKYRWLPTWSVAGKWIISSERFMQDVRWLSLLSIRGSYGLQGNIHDDATPYMIVQFGSRDGYSGIEYYTINRLPNPDLRWEKTKTWNAAVDFSFLDHRIRGSFDIFNKNTEDLIMSKDIASSNGRSTMMVNAGKMTNKGYEFFIQADIIRRRSIEWRLGLNFGRTVNEIVLANMGEYTEKEKINQMLSGNYAVEGEPIGSMYSYKYAGLNDENGYPMFYAKDGSKVHFGHPEMMELVNCGSIYPDLAGGFDTQLTYKKTLSLSLAFTYSLGGVSRLPVIYQKTGGAFDPFYNVSTVVNNRWREPGDKTDIPKLYDTREVSQIYKEHDEWKATNPESTSATMTYPLAFYNYSDLRTAKTNYLRLKSVALSYHLPASFLKQFHVSSAQVRFQASNLFVIANKEWRGLDPETPQGSIPVLPAYSLSLNISF